MKKKYFYSRQSISQEDIKEVIKVLKSDYLTQGPAIQKFEEAVCEYTGAAYAVAVANGTAALHLAAIAAGIGPEVEAITSPVTFVASSNCVLYCGGKIRFADIDSNTACIDPSEIIKQITLRTKLIIPVHFAGQPCDMEAIADLARVKKISVIEDAAHALGSVYKGTKIGACAFSDMTIFSFHPVKTITTGEGGMITTNNERLYKELLLLRSHGITKDPALLSGDKGDWYYEMHTLGYNYRMTDIQAALGISQLKRLDQFVQRRREIVEMYKTLLGNDNRFNFLKEKEGNYSAYHLCPLLIDFRAVLKDKREIFTDLQKEGLFLQVHYIPVHTQPFYAKLGFKSGDYPRAESYYHSSLSLPLHPQLKNSDINAIVRTIKKVIK